MVNSRVTHLWCSFGLPAIGPYPFLALQDPHCCLLKLRIWPFDLLLLPLIHLHLHPFTASTVKPEFSLGEDRDRDRRGNPEAGLPGAVHMVGGVSSDSPRTRRMRTVRGRRGGSADGMMDDGEAGGHLSSNRSWVGESTIGHTTLDGIFAVSTMVRDGVVVGMLPNNQEDRENMDRRQACAMALQVGIEYFSGSPWVGESIGDARDAL
ncbi:hypothetical protein B0H17DRAFT_1145714 [Mycena rosella]|uniref:Uncharacterized protein n=1 Tax=Mycena rosella TaxID=1033263 RepID=A0AAD7CQG7_MYCRO|nr:hypothetical protein B0H17DRAFT_1145714 [Mycena rosella]